MLKKTIFIFYITIAHNFQASENSLTQQYQEIRSKCTEICESYEAFYQDFQNHKNNNKLSAFQISQLYHLQEIKPQHCHALEKGIERRFEFLELEDVDILLETYQSSVSKLKNNLDILKSKMKSFLQP